VRLPSISFGHVQPFGLRSTIIGQRTSREASVARVALDALDLGDDGVEGGGHLLVHLVGVVTLDEVRR
jgi:hypothetical protein